MAVMLSVPFAHTSRLCPWSCARAHKAIDLKSPEAYLPAVSIGMAIRSAREAKGWSQPELAGKVGAARETVCRWETGSITNIPQRTLMALESVLGPLGKVESKPSRKVAARS